MKKINKYAVGAALGLSLFLPFLAMTVLAQGVNIPLSPIIGSPRDITRILEAILGWLSGVIFTISLIMLFYAAILYMTAGASETTLAKSKNVLIYAVVGLAVAILTFSFRPFLETFFRGNFQ